MTLRESALRNRTDLALALLLGVIASAISIAYVTPFVEWGDDFALYLSQARAVSAGELERELAVNLRVKALNDVIVGPPAAPWGFPILLSLAARVVGWDIVDLKLIGVVSVGVIAALSYLIARRYAGRLASACVATLLGAQPFITEAADRLVSDLPFLAVATATLLLAERLTDAGRPEQRPRWSLIALGAVLSVSGYAIRSNGAFLPVALFASLAVAWYRESSVTKRRLETEMLVLTALTATGALLYMTGLPDGSLEHVSYLTLEASSVRRRVVEVVSSFSEFMPFLALRTLRPIDSTIGVILTLLTLAISAYGAWRHRRHVAALIVFLVLNTALLLAFPADGGARYSLSLLLPLVILVCAGIVALHQAAYGSSVGAARSKGMHIIGIAIPSLIIAGMFATGLAMSRRAPDTAVSGPLTPVADSLFRFVRANVPEDTPISFFKPRALRWFTGRLGMSINNAEHADRAPYVILNKRKEDARWQIHWQADRTALDASPDWGFTSIYESSQFVVLRRYDKRVPSSMVPPP